MENDFTELEALLAEIQNSSKKTRDQRAWGMGDGDGFKLERIPIGIPGLDRMLHWGIPKKRMTLLTGQPSCGKSYIATQACAQVQRAGGTVGRIDAELSWDKDWIAQCGLDPSKVMVAQPTTGEEAMEVLAEWLDGIKLDEQGKTRTPPVDIIVLDSLAALCPKNIQEDEYEKSPMAWQSRLINSSFPRFFSKIQNGSAFIAINQQRAAIGNYQPAMPGGIGQEFYSHLIMEVRRGGWLPNKEAKAGERTGFNMRFKITKTKVGGLVEDTCEAPFTYDEGIKEQEVFIDEGLYQNIIETTSAGRYEYQEQKFHGRKTLLKSMEENPELYELLKEEVRKYAPTL